MLLPLSVRARSLYAVTAVRAINNETSIVTFEQTWSRLKCGLICFLTFNFQRRLTHQTRLNKSKDDNIFQMYWHASAVKLLLYYNKIKKQRSLTFLTAGGREKGVKCETRSRIVSPFPQSAKHPPRK